MDDAIDAAYLAGVDAWPDVELAREAFASYVAGIERPALEQFGVDLYLAAACAAASNAAIAAFERALGSAARGPIHAIDKNAAFVDEGMQKLRAHLFVGEDARIKQYRGRGPLAAWVGIAAARTALMLIRSRARQREVSEDDWGAALATITTNDPELDLFKRQYADAFQTALRDSIASLEARPRTVLRMSFVEGLSIDDIGGVYAVHRATAARWIQSACETVFERTRQLMSERLKLSGTELDKITALVRSQLDVSLSQLLPLHVSS